jgi:hypothetical protein
VLYEYLGEEYPEVLGSILGALKAIVNVIGMTRMTPPIKELLPRLTPVLKNRWVLNWIPSIIMVWATGVVIQVVCFLQPVLLQPAINGIAHSYSTATSWFLQA